jgi:hypothetical protein
VVLRAIERESVDRWSYLSQFGSFPEPDMLSAPMCCPAGSADLLSFSLPCEISSSAGTQAGLTGTTEKAKRTMALFHNFIDRLATEAPRSALLENVLGLRHTNEGADFDFVLRHIRGTGFVVGNTAVGSSDLGSVQRRPRIYLLILRADVATHSSWLIVDIRPKPSHTSRATAHVIRDILHLQRSREELVKGGAVFFPASTVEWITGALPVHLPDGPEDQRPFVRCAHEVVPPAARHLADVSRQVFVVGYLQRPFSRSHLRAGHQVVDINGCLPTSGLSP